MRYPITDVDDVIVEITDDQFVRVLNRSLIASGTALPCGSGLTVPGTGAASGAGDMIVASGTALVCGSGLTPAVPGPLPGTAGNPWETDTDQDLS